MNYIRGQWILGRGGSFESINPATGASLWRGTEATQQDVDAAVGAARDAFDAWSDLSFESRVSFLQRFAELLEQNQQQLTAAIAAEVGKPKWDAAGELKAMIGKIPISIDAHRQRRSETRIDLADVQGATRYIPHGVLCVFGPFNFPGHIANGLIVPSLLAGNTVVFKPSELTPRVAEMTVKLWQQAGLPAGVLNLLQGGGSTGAMLVEHRDHNGVLFTGSLPTAVAIRRALVERPEAIVVLELGGNNPLVVHDAADIDAAVYWTIQSAYITSGQRCTCARRLIVPAGNDRFIERLTAVCSSIAVGAPDDDPEPFCGPVIHAEAAARVLNEQQRLTDHGGEVLVPAEILSRGPAFVSPGLVDVTNCQTREDTEVFGPLLQLIRVDDMRDAVAECNNTRYGLVASFFGRSRADYETFRRHVRAGLINWNRPTTGASSRLPFGGVGASGNHRPAGYFSADFCNSPIGSLEAENLSIPDQPSPGLPAF